MKLSTSSHFWVCSHGHIRKRLACIPPKRRESTLRKISMIRIAHYLGLYATALLVTLTIISQGVDGLRSLQQLDLVTAIFSVLQGWGGLIAAILLALHFRSTSFAGATLFGVPLGLILAGTGVAIQNSEVLGEGTTYFVSLLFIWAGICFPSYISFAILKERIISKAIDG